MEKNNTDRVLEKGLKGDFDLPVRAVFSEAWKNVKGIKSIIFTSEIYTCLIVFLVMLVALLLAIFMGSLLGPLKDLFNFVGGLVSGAVMICAVAFLNRTAIRKLVGKEITARHFFKPYVYFWEALVLYVFNILVLVPIVLLFFVFALLAVVLTGGGISIATSFSWGHAHSNLGLWMHLVIGLDLVICYLIYSFFTTLFQLVIPVAMDKKIKVRLALRFLFKAFSKKFFSIILINFLSLLIILISVIPIGLGLIWSLPLAFSLNAVIYKRALGI